MVERIKTKLEHQDEFGVINYNNSFLFLAAFALLYTLIALLAVPLVWFETTQGGDSANITTYADAFWTLQMSASTIGFGDFYPVTLGGGGRSLHWCFIWAWDSLGLLGLSSRLDFSVLLKPQLKTES